MTENAGNIEEEGPISLEPEAEEEPAAEPAAEQGEDLEPIGLVEPEEEAAESGIRSIKRESPKEAGHELHRALHATGTGATRCKLFHSKIADGSLRFMEQQINEWLDNNDDIEVKHVGHMVGPMVGKTSSEPNVLIMVWY